MSKYPFNFSNIFVRKNFTVHNKIYLPVVPHKAVAEVSKMGNLQERLILVKYGWQSESID